MRIADLTAEIERVAPPETALEWDNVGLQLGSPEEPLERVLICLEVTDEVLDEAAGCGAELIIAHHPLIFRPMEAIRTDQPLGAMIRRAMSHGIAIYVAHTNLDAAPEVGTAAVLAEMLELSDTRPLIEEDGAALGLVGDVAATTLCGLARRIEEMLQPTRLSVVGEDRLLERVAVMPGSGGDAVPAAARCADALVCGDLKHHDALDALASGLAVIDAGHYATERPVVPRLAEHLRERFGPELEVIESDAVTDPFAGAPCASEGN